MKQMRSEKIGKEKEGEKDEISCLIELELIRASERMMTMMIVMIPLSVLFNYFFPHHLFNFSNYIHPFLSDLTIFFSFFPLLLFLSCVSCGRCTHPSIF